MGGGSGHGPTLEARLADLRRQMQRRAARRRFLIRWGRRAAYTLGTLALVAAALWGLAALA